MPDAPEPTGYTPEQRATAEAILSLDLSAACWRMIEVCDETLARTPAEHTTARGHLLARKAAAQSRYDRLRAHWDANKGQVERDNPNPFGGG